MSENTYRCRSCGWKGNQLRKTGCLTYADTWYVCPSCNQDASECLSIVDAPIRRQIELSDKNMPDRPLGKIGNSEVPAGTPPGV